MAPDPEKPGPAQATFDCKGGNRGQRKAQPVKRHLGSIHTNANPEAPEPPRAPWDKADPPPSAGVGDPTSFAGGLQCCRGGRGKGQGLP